MINDLNLYKVFYEVAKSQNISHAAKALYISQPAVSKSIKNLENTLGLSLFSRNSKGVYLTPEGKVLFEHIQKAFIEFQKSEDLLTRMQHLESGELTLGVSSILGKYILLPHLQNFMTHYPHIKIRMINLSTQDTLKLVDLGKLDMALVSLSLPYTELSFTPLIPLQDILVCHPCYLKTLKNAYPTYSFENNFNSLLKKASLMLLAEPNLTRMYLNNYFKSLDLQLTPDIEASNMDFLIECAKTGLGITSFIKNFITDELEQKLLVEIPLPHPMPPRLAGIVSNPQLPPSLAATTFIHFLKTNMIP